MQGVGGIGVRGWGVERGRQQEDEKKGRRDMESWRCELSYGRVWCTMDGNV